MSYTKDYWERNRERILAERRERYRSDPEYRAASRERSRQRRARERSKREKAGLTVLIGTTEVPAVRADAVCAGVAGLTRDRLAYLHKERYLPRALRTSPMRCYTAHQVSLIGELVALLDAGGGPPRGAAGGKPPAAFTALIERIHSTWEHH